MFLFVSKALVNDSGKDHGCQLLVTKDKLLVLDAQTDSSLHIFPLQAHVLVREEGVETEGESSVQQKRSRIHVYKASEQVPQAEKQAQCQHILEQYLHLQPKANTPSHLLATSRIHDVTPLPTSHQLEVVVEETEAHRLCYVFNYFQEHLVHPQSHFECVRI